VRGHPCLVYEQRVRSVGAILAEARRWRDREFIIHGRRRITFAGHGAAVSAAAARMTERGVRAGDRVALFAGNCPEWSVAFFAVLQLGAIAVPFNRWWSPHEVAHAFDLTTPVLVVADTERAERLADRVSVLFVEQLSAGLEDGTADPGASLEPTLGDEDEDRPAVILFTAGTTGFPKGATLSHRSLVANVQSLLVVSRRLPHQLGDQHPASVTLVSLPLFHIGAVQLLLVPLVAGGKLIFPEGKFDPGEVLRLVEDEGVTMWSAVPTMAERVLVHPDLRKRDVSPLRTIVLGGASVPSGLLDRVGLAFPNAGRRVGQSYGLTEAGGVLATGVAKDLADRRGSSGRFVPVAEIRIDQPDDAGVGEIWARSPAVMDGYWALPDDPVLSRDGWLHTGDLGRVDDDGFLYITGRVKDTIIRGGENIAAAHVEARLVEHPDVREVAVVGLPHPDLGEEVGAVVTLASEANTTGAALEAFARPALAHFEIPSQWWLRHDELPKTDSGKIVKHQLRAEWIARRQGQN
jgi:long-chain acyl-CoA synthetase